MSSKAVDWAWGQRIPDLPPLPPSPSGSRRPRAAKATLKNVLLALAEHANPDGRCFPNWRTIARMPRAAGRPSPGRCGTSMLEARGIAEGPLWPTISVIPLVIYRTVPRTEAF